MSVILDADRRRRSDPNGVPPDVLARFHAHRPLAGRLAARYRRSADFDDLRQVADIALLLAAQRYVPERGAFERFATVTISGELKKHLRRTGWHVHVPRRVQEDALTVQAAIDRLTVELGRTPRLADVADRTALTSERVSQAIRARMARYALADGRPDRTAAVGTADDFVDHLELRAAIANLADVDRHLLSLVFDDDLSQRQIATRINVSQSQVQRRLARILETLQRTLTGCVDVEC